ncbi:glycosyltransferase [Candidatus Omnitrophota bacterium]
MLKEKILLSGQINNVTEMLEGYLKDEAAVLGLIGISNPYTTPGSARASYYEKGALKSNRSIFNIYFRHKKGYPLYLFIFVYIAYFCSIVRSALRFKTKFDIFIGVSTFSAFLGIILKKLGRVRKVVYYSIDYFPLNHRSKFEDFMGRSFFLLDSFCAKYSDMTWHINPDIAKARATFARLKPEKYTSINVPLGFGEGMLSPSTFSEIEKFTLVFAGALHPEQGLQMVIKAFPEILDRFPQAKLVIIGSGFFAPEVKKMVDHSLARNRIILKGFISDLKELSGILSHCAVGLATWDMSAENCIRYADPSKPKHYAFCGLPVIITRTNAIADEIDDLRAGIAINYDEKEFVDAVSRLLGDEKLLQDYRENALKFAHRYISANIYKKALEQTFKRINQI